jgi:hypothetical protein
MARKYARDKRGRFASTGTGATARGGRLKTASGNTRATQTIQAGGRAGVIGKPAGSIKPRSSIGSVGAKLAARDRAAAAPAPKAMPAAAPNAKKRLNFQVVYHGTSKTAGDAIKKGGFRESKDGFLGKGVYFSSEKQVGSFYKTMAQNKTGGGALLRARVLKSSVKDVKHDSYFAAQAAAKKGAQSHVKKGKTARLLAEDDLQKVMVTSAANANRGLIRGTGTIRRRRR